MHLENAVRCLSVAIMRDIRAESLLDSTGAAGPSRASLHVVRVWAGPEWLINQFQRELDLPRRARCLADFAKA